MYTFEQAKVKFKDTEFVIADTEQGPIIIGLVKLKRIKNE